MVDFQPTDEQALVVETVHQFAANEIRPRARECDESRALPAEVLNQSHALGLITTGLPEALGGGGERQALRSALVAEELGWGDLAIALAILSPGLVAYPVADSGAGDAPRILERFLGDHFAPACLALLEPGFGADPFRPKTRAVRSGGDFVLSGEKCLAPFGAEKDAGPLLVIATSDEGPAAFLVERDAVGLEATPDSYMGIRALPTAALRLEEVRVPERARLPEFDLAGTVTRGRVALAALGVGVARAAYEVARDYAKEREAFGVKIAQKQAIAFKLADMAIEIDGCRLLAWEAAWRLDQGADALREATLAISQIRRVALDIADGAVQVLGGHGYIREYLPEMHLRNARGLTAFECLALV